MKVTISALTVLASAVLPAKVSAQQCNTVTGDGTTDPAIAMRAWCDSLPAGSQCCRTSGGTADSNVCSGWSPNISSITLCEGSCVGFNACNNAFESAGSGSVISIAANACDSTEACFEFASDVDGVLTASIGAGACSGGNDACEFLLQQATGDVTVTIGDGSCVGFVACDEAFQEVGESSGSVFAIGAGSCVGTSACNDFGERMNVNGTKTVSIGDGACVETFACHFFAEDADIVETVTIAAGGCVGKSACKEVAGTAYAINTVSIGAGGCVGADACHYAAESADILETFSVAAGQCVGDNVCQNCGDDHDTVGPFSATATCCAVDSANVDEACLRVPQDPPTDPCAGNNCDGHGKCSSGGPNDSKCTCENTFEEIVKSNGKPSCACPSDTKLQANINRCVPIETSAPTAAPTVNVSFISFSNLDFDHLYFLIATYFYYFRSLR